VVVHDRQVAQAEFVTEPDAIGQIAPAPAVGDSDVQLAGPNSLGQAITASASVSPLHKMAPQGERRVFVAFGAQFPGHLHAASLTQDVRDTSFRVVLVEADDLHVIKAGRQRQQLRGVGYDNELDGCGPQVCPELLLHRGMHRHGRFIEHDHRRCIAGED
jgi:hypothetical protein